MTREEMRKEIQSMSFMAAISRERKDECAWDIIRWHERKVLEVRHGSYMDGYHDCDKGFEPQLKEHSDG